MFFCSKVCHWQKVEIRFIKDPLRIYKGGPGVVRGGNEKKKADKSIRRSRSLEACFEKRKLIKEKKIVMHLPICNAVWQVQPISTSLFYIKGGCETMWDGSQFLKWSSPSRSSTTTGFLGSMCPAIICLDSSLSIRLCIALLTGRAPNCGS